MQDIHLQRKKGIPLIRTGMKVRFDPFLTIIGFGVDEMRHDVVGTVVAVYYEHKWFSVQYGKLRTSFKFCDIGDTVHICK